MKYRKFIFLLLFTVSDISFSTNIFSSTNTDIHFKLKKIVDEPGLTTQKLSSQISRISANRKESVELIYHWIAENISYDYDGYINNTISDGSPENVLKTRMAVCEGYAKLFYDIAKQLGIETEIIHGFSKGYGYQAGGEISSQPNHSWNAVKLDGQWFLLDATWGAGYIDKGKFTRKFQGFYLFTDPESFIYDHFPVNPEWQLTNEHITLENFKNLPFLRPPFFISGLKLESHKKGIINSTKQLKIEFNGAPDVILMGRLIKDGQFYDRNVFIQNTLNNYIILVKIPAAGKYTLRIFSKKKNSLEKSYPWSMDYIIDASSGSNSIFPLSYSHMEYGVILNSPLEGTLKSSRVQYFSIQVPNAESVAVKIGETWKLLDKKNNSYSGKINIQKGKIIVFVRFLGAENYTGILEYQGI